MQEVKEEQNKAVIWWKETKSYGLITDGNGSLCNTTPPTEAFARWKLRVANILYPLIILWIISRFSFAMFPYEYHILLKLNVFPLLLTPVSKLRRDTLRRGEWLMLGFLQLSSHRTQDVCSTFRLAILSLVWTPEQQIWYHQSDFFQFAVLCTYLTNLSLSSNVYTFTNARMYTKDTIEVFNIIFQT